MNYGNGISLGPTYLSTLFCNDLANVLPSYCDHLSLSVDCISPLDKEIATLWHLPQLEGTPSALLKNRTGEVWLRIVEVHGARKAIPLKEFGWMALEVSVQGVDELAVRLSDSPFTVLRAPADLDISDQLRACQVQGLCEEVFYFTEIKGDVPGFDLFPARCTVDKLFIPVLCAPDRSASTAFYCQFPGLKGQAFDTVVSVVNQAWKLPLNTRQPIATVALNGGNFIEIDELALASSRRATDGLATGIATVAFWIDDIRRSNVAWTSQPRKISAAPYNGCTTGLVKGAAGEWVEIVERRG